MNANVKTAESFIDIQDAPFFRTRHTRRDTSKVMTYTPPGQSPYIRRLIECTLVLVTGDYVDEITTDRELRARINAGEPGYQLFGVPDDSQTDTFIWRVTNTDFNYEPGDVKLGDLPIRLILTVMYTAWEKEILP